MHHGSPRREPGEGPDGGGREPPGGLAPRLPAGPWGGGVRSAPAGSSELTETATDPGTTLTARGGADSLFGCNGLQFLFLFFIAPRSPA